MMKMRTTNPPVRTASGTASHQEIDRLKYINHHRRAYEPNVLVICQIARASEGSWYFATISFHCATAIFFSDESLILSEHQFSISEHRLSTNTPHATDLRSARAEMKGQRGPKFPLEKP